MEQATSNSADATVVAQASDAGAVAAEAAPKAAAAATTQATANAAPVIGTISAPKAGVEIVRGSQRIPVIADEAVVIGDRIVVPDSTQASMVFAAPAAGEDQVTATLKPGTDASFGWKQAESGLQEVTVDVASGDLVVNASDVAAEASKIVVKKPAVAGIAWGDLALGALAAAALVGLATRDDGDNTPVPPPVTLPPAVPPQFTVTHAPASVNEGQAVVFTVTRTGDTSGTQTVNFTTAGVTAGNSKPATPGTDFSPATGSVTFAPGETSKTFTVDALTDSNGNEGPEAFAMTSTVDGKTVDTQTVVINDVDPGVPLLNPTQVLLGQLPTQSGAGALTPVLVAATPVLNVVDSVSNVLNAATAPLLGSTFRPSDTGILDPVDSLGSTVVNSVAKPVLDAVLTPLAGANAAENAAKALTNQVDFVTDGVQNLLGANPVSHLASTAGVNTSPDQFIPLANQIQGMAPISASGVASAATGPLGSLTSLLPI